jgi:hypothetical protein
MHLQPALDADASLRFFFEIHAPNMDEEYEAISYTWGEPIMAYPVYVTDGSHVMVTKNLDRALRNFRYATKPRALWADAICINQADDRDKGLQIPLMTRIFRSASRVLAWLSGGAKEERGMNILKQLSRLPQTLTNDVLGHDGRTHTQDDNVAIRSFFSLAWFTRLWM